MKTGKSLVELATEIESQRSRKIDFVAPTSQISVATHDNGLVLDAGSAGTYRLRDLAVTQVADRLGIPIKYVRKMQAEQPEILAHNFNTWFREKPERRLIRTIDGHARAFLSDRYQRIDNTDVAQAVLPAFQDFPGLQIRSTEITEHRLYIKASLPSLTREIKSKRVGDLVEAGVMISNSEVGLGSVSVTPFAFFLVCTNGMVRDGVKRWNHVGGRIKSEELAYLTDETVKASDRVDLMVIRDTLKHALSEVSFDGWLDKIQATTTRAITGRVQESVRILSEKLVLTDTEENSVLRHLIEGGDLSQYGLMNAVTRTAEDAESYDRATDLEAFGQKVIDLPANDWRVIAEAA